MLLYEKANCTEQEISPRDWIHNRLYDALSAEIANGFAYPKNFTHIDQLIPSKQENVNKELISSKKITKTLNRKLWFTETKMVFLPVTFL